jgi:alpha-1,2-mannosyltransferase
MTSLARRLADRVGSVRWNIAAGVVLASSVVWLLYRVLQPSAADQFVDLQVYRLGGRAVLEGSDLYGFRSAHNGPFTYPPFAALLFTPFAGWTVTAGGLVMAAATFAAFCAIIVMLVRHARPVPLSVVLFSAAVAVQTEAIASNVLWGQVNVVLAALVIADVVLPSTPWPRGLLIGVAVAIKLTPALFIVFLVVSGKYRAARNAMLTATALTAAAWALLPDASRAYWFDALWQTGRVGAADGPRNRSLWGLVLRFDLPEPLRHILLGVALLTLVLVALARAAKAARLGDEMTAVSIVGLSCCLVSPVTWSHHVVWLIPCAALILYRREWWSWPALTAILLLSQRDLQRAIPGFTDYVVAQQTVLMLLLVVLLPNVGRLASGGGEQARTQTARYPMWTARMRRRISGSRPLTSSNS